MNYITDKMRYPFIASAIGMYVSLEMVAQAPAEILLEGFPEMALISGAAVQIFPHRNLLKRIDSFGAAFTGSMVAGMLYF